MRLISFCKILLLSGCFTTVCTSMNAQDKVMKKQDSPIDIDLWHSGYMAWVSFSSKNFSTMLK